MENHKLVLPELLNQFGFLIAATLEHQDCLFETERSRKGKTSVTYSVVVRRDSEAIFSTPVTLVRVDGRGEKMPLPI